MSMLTVKALQGNQFVVKLSQCWNLHNFQYQIVKLTYTMVKKIWLVNRGCMTRFQQLAPETLYFHCASYDLNLALPKASNNSDIKCMADIMKTVVILFKYSPTKQALLEQCIESFNRGAVENGIQTIYLRKVKLLCNPIWVEQHNSMFGFCKLFEVIIQCFEILRQDDNEGRTWDCKSITRLMSISVFTGICINSQVPNKWGGGGSEKFPKFNKWGVGN